MKNKVRGFSLIELMIAVAIVAILAKVVAPSWMQQIRKGRRSDAVAMISKIEQAEERWRSNNASYTNNFLNLTLTTTSATSLTSEGGYYTMTVTPDATTPETKYVVTATAVSGTSQTSDTFGSTDCSTLTATVTGGNPVTAPSACWSQ
jgi:type IV pilus assembly protein PilE